MKRQDGVSIFQCIYCGRKFYSSQAIAAHTRCHFKDANAQQLPPSLASSSRCQPQLPRHHLRLSDANTLCRFKASLTKNEEEEKESRKQSTEVEVIPNKNFDAAIMFGTTNYI
ncbi:hypothetical protein H5410_049996 [Solanum commersonii]|uniref:C2H2-type domain-containing protein n=1 Tax=Solanum commersonii TaxID=4109 RepID=A0A9J5WU84_SOLCO|nr:hypothetical protein H5410_049996 [Solanum commersonii]